jgi:hypothetical protein
MSHWSALREKNYAYYWNSVVNIDNLELFCIYYTPLRRLTLIWKRNLYRCIWEGITYRAENYFVMEDLPRFNMTEWIFIAHSRFRQLIRWGPSPSIARWMTTIGRCSIVMLLSSISKCPFGCFMFSPIFPRFVRLSSISVLYQWFSEKNPRIFVLHQILNHLRLQLLLLFYNPFTWLYLGLHITATLGFL